MKKKNVLLINPVFEDLPPQFPMGLAYLAASLEKGGIPVAVLDANAYRMSEEAILEAVRKVSPTIIGITVPTLLIQEVSRLAAIIKRGFPKIKSLFGIRKLGRSGLDLSEGKILHGIGAEVGK